MGGCATKPKVSKTEVAEKLADEPPPEAKKEVMVVMEAADYSERVKEIVGDDDVNNKGDEHSTLKRRSLSFLFEEVKEEEKEVTVEAGDYSERVKEIVGDDNDNGKVDKHGIHKRRSLSLLFEEGKEAKKEVVVMVEAGDYGERVKEIIGDDDITDKIDEHGIHKRRSLSLLFEEEGKESAIKDKASTELVKQSRKGDIPNSNLASEAKQSGKSGVIVEEQLAFAAGDAVQEESDETQKIDAATPKLVRKSKQMEKIVEKADENVEIM
ncbi:uncharacterized protein LOC115681995 isoform X2 [Syzygium oleosum]|uniref:uncharacterized protein LOC115681995 isoform X2 n=1 Tax=Syzygium oleosum TaxID=219896 RepID=UPI0024BBD673|nr:uncharacterized protein LOC115681995 isoform X2 [Syzygium oleosum]